MSVVTKTRIALIASAEGIASVVGKLFTALPTDTSADPTVARALDTATRVNSSGNIETVVANKGRIDFGLGVNRCPNLLVERSRTNLFATPLVPATQNVTVVNATVYTVSVVGSGSITLSGAGSGVVTEANPITFTSAGTTLTCTVAGSLGGASVTAGAVAMSVANGTANADVISKTGIGTLLSGAKGLFVDCYLQAGSLIDTETRITAMIGDSANPTTKMIYLYRYQDGIGYEVYDGSLVAGGNVAITTPFKNKRIKLFISFETNNIVFYVNAVSALTDTSNTIPVLNSIAVGNNLSAGSQWDGLIKAVAVTDELTESEIAQLSSYPSFSDMASEMIYETV
jgi:hypothetical protein